MKHFGKMLIIFLLGACAANTSQSENSTSAGSADGKKVSGGSTASVAEGEFIITGKVKGAENNTLSLDQYFINRAPQTITTFTTGPDGSFQVKGKLPEKGIFLIRLNPSVNWLLVLDGGKVNFEADASDIYHFKVEGSPETRSFADFIIRAGENQFALNQLYQQQQQARFSGNLQQMINLQQQYQSRYEEAQRYIRSYADTATHRLSAVFAASLLNAEENADYLREFIARAEKELPQSGYVADLKQRVESSLRLAIGSIAPDFELKTPEGKKIKLSSTRGKVVLLDFWASWCRPCRIENPNLVRLYDKYHAKGFDIFSVSLDRDMQRWVEAIKQDNLKWKNHGSNLMYWQEPVAKLYEVSSIPQTFLIDRDGRIVARNLRGEALEKKLAEIFGS
ncbi:MAG: hypothetical protein KatS3mg031_2083 [Chitinophagales bacterium]|nr:MAG: hypothetical protein KatS3mg031_2083 [Chitinophagales bacterium]